IVRGDLERPARLAGVGIAGEKRARPLVVAGSQVGIPHAGVSGAVEDQVQLRVVRDPSPDVGAAELPLVAGPGGRAQVLALVLCVARLETGAAEDVLVGARVVSAQAFLPRPEIERGYPSPHH